MNINETGTRTIKIRSWWAAKKYWNNIIIARDVVGDGRITRAASTDNIRGRDLTDRRPTQTENDIPVRRRPRGSPLPLHSPGRVFTGRGPVLDQMEEFKRRRTKIILLLRRPGPSRRYPTAFPTKISLLLLLLLLLNRFRFRLGFHSFVRQTESLSRNNNRFMATTQRDDLKISIAIHNNYGRVRYDTITSTWTSRG